MTELFAICAPYEIQDGDARGFVLARLDADGNKKAWPIFIARRGNSFHGYENICPHEGKRLDAYPGEFLDREANFLACGRHQAKFDPDTGACFIGPCKGKSLTPIEIVVDDGDVCLVNVPLAEEDGLDVEDPNEVPEVLITGD